MIGKVLAPFLTPLVEKAAGFAEEHNFSHNKIVYVSLGLVGAVFIFLVSGLYALALLSVLGHRLAIAVARKAGLDDSDEEKYGKYMRLFSDYLFFGGFLFFFMMAQDGAFVPGAFLFFAFYVNEAADYAYRRIFGDDELKPSSNANKALFSLVDHSMISMFFVLMCLLPVGFPFFAVILGFMCFASTIGGFMEIRLKYAGLLDPIEEDDDEDMKPVVSEEPKKEEKPKKKPSKKKGDDLPELIEDR